MVTYTPPGWPAGVHPPGSDDFESTAVGWLLDVVPPDYRLHGVLRRYPIALATMARHHSKACVDGARQGYRMARTELAGALPPHAVDTVLAAYRKEGARLAATARAVGLVERALRGEVFTPAMGDPKPASRQAEPKPDVATPAGPGQTEPEAAKASKPKRSERPVVAGAGARQGGASQGGPSQGGASQGGASQGGAPRAEAPRAEAKRPARQGKAT